MTLDFNNLMEKAKDLAQTGVAKAKELSDTAVVKGKQATEIGKLKVQNATEMETVKKAYIELGKLYFAQHGAAPDPDYAELCGTITDSLAKVDYNNERIADLKAVGGLTDEEVAEAPCACCGEETAPGESPADTENDKPQE